MDFGEEWTLLDDLKIWWITIGRRRKEVIFEILEKEATKKKEITEGD